MSGLLDAIGYVGDSFDKLGGRPLRGLLGGKPREALSFIPFSDRLGITDPNDIVSGRDLTDKAGLTRKGSRDFLSGAAGFGADIALDPTNLLGGLGIHKLSKIGKTARNVGRAEDLSSAVAKAPKGWGALDLAIGDPHPTSPKRTMMVDPWGGEQEPALIADAIRHGPRYGGDLDKLAELMRGSETWSSFRADRVLGHPLAKFAAHEIPEGTKPLSSGAEAFTGLTPWGSVVRVQPTFTTPLAEQGIQWTPVRPDIPEMLQPARTAEYLGAHLGGFRVEHLPKVEPVYPSKQAHNIAFSVDDPEANDLIEALRRHAQSVSDRGAEMASRRQLDPWDVGGNITNVSLTPENKGIIHDGGSLAPLNRENPIVYPNQAELPSRGRIEAIESFGGPEAVRQAILDGISKGTQGQGFDVANADEIRANMDRLQQILAPHMRTPELHNIVRRRSFDQSDILRAFDSASLDAPSSVSRPGAASSPGLGGRFASVRNGATARKMPYLPDDAKNARGIYGGYSSANKTAYTFPTSPNQGATARHEAGHALVDQASQLGPAAILKLPAAWQPAAWVKWASSKGSTVNQFGKYLDEMGQRATQNRGLGISEQIMEMGRFLANRGLANAYATQNGANQFGRALMTSPAALWENRVPIGIAALSSADLARAMSQLRASQE